MSKFSNFITLIFILLYFILGGCYTNKEISSYKNQTEKLIGEWNIQEFLINGNDSSEYFNKYPISLILFLEEQNEVRFYFSGLDSIVTKHLWGTWTFDALNKKIKIDYSISFLEDDIVLNYHVFRRRTVNEWNIIRFNKKELILETNQYSNHYRLHLIKAKNPRHKKTTN